METARQFLAVALVFGLLGAATWTLRRPSPGMATSISPMSWLSVLKGLRPAEPAAKAPQLIRVGRLALTPQHTLHLVLIDGAELVVATHPQGCSVLRRRQADAGAGA